MRKLMILALMSFLSIGLIFIYANNHLNYSDVMGEVDITSIKVFYQPNHESYVINTTEEIDGFVELLVKCKYDEITNEDKRSTGYIYSLTLLNGADEVARLSLGEEISFNSKVYKILNNDFNSISLINYLDILYDNK